MAVIVNQPGETSSYEQSALNVALTQAVTAAGKLLITFNTAAIGTSTAYHFTVPIAGTIEAVYSVLNGAITTDDAVLTLAHNGSGSFVNVTGGAITIATSGSAAGDQDSATPSALNTVAAGDIIRITDDGAAGGTSTAGITVVVDVSTSYVSESE